MSGVLLRVGLLSFGGLLLLRRSGFCVNLALLFPLCLRLSHFCLVLFLSLGLLLSDQLLLGGVICDINEIVSSMYVYTSWMKFDIPNLVLILGVFLKMVLHQALSVRVDAVE